MSLTITLQPETSANLLRDAQAAGVSIDQYAEDRFTELAILWRIRNYFSAEETTDLRKLVGGMRANKLAEDQRERMQSLLNDREFKAGERLKDLISLSKLRNIPVQDLMNQLGIAPISLE